MHYFDEKQIEQLDELAVQNGLEVRQMMEFAGWHILSLFRELKISKGTRVAIFCGKGNKAGDGLSAARHLVNHGFNVYVILLSREMSPDALHQLRLLEKMGVQIVDYPDENGKAEQAIPESGIAIDALIGYHLKGSPRGLFKEVIELINASGKKIISYDLPSGVDATTGECLAPCIKANTTLTLAAPKKAFESKEGRVASGVIFVADIGIPQFIYDNVIPQSRPDFQLGGILKIF